MDFFSTTPEDFYKATRCHIPEYTLFVDLNLIIYM
jgi:hypothetical protein